MLTRISCDRPAALWSDGAFLGTLAGEPRYAELGDILELRPITGGGAVALPLCFPSRSLEEPREDVSAVRYGALLDVFIRIPALPPRGTQVVFQQALNFREARVLATVFRDGGDKLSVDGPGLFGILDLPAGLSDFELSPEYLDGAPCACLSAARAGRKYLFVYDLSASRLLYRGPCNSFSFGRSLVVERTEQDLARHRITERWDLAEGGLRLADYAAARGPEFAFVGLRDHAKPYALAEEVLVGGNPADFLVPAMRENAGRIAEYLGDFTAVLPPPSLSRKKGAALVRKSGRADFLTVELEGGLISNIRVD